MQFKSLLSFPIAFIFLNAINQGLSCMGTFKNSQNISFIEEDCTNCAGFSATPKLEELAMEDFDDKCLSKCLLGGLQLIDNEGKIDRDLMLDFTELNAPESYLLKLSELASQCTESSGADKISGGSKLGKSRDECSPMQQFYACFASGADKLC